MAKLAAAAMALATSTFLPLLAFVFSSLCIVASISAPPLCIVDSASGVVSAPAVVNVMGKQEVNNNCNDSHVRVFPLLSKEESEELILAAEAAALTRGWDNRYAGTDLEEYGTTDLAVREVPELWALVEPHLQQAAISIKTTLGADVRNIEDLRFDDIFLVRYSADGQRSLRSHEDGSAVTFQVALNEGGVDFDDGGTLFEELGCRVQLRVGEAHTFPGHVRHQGFEITRGKRYILVGFWRGHRQDDDEVSLSFGSEYKITLDPIVEDYPCVGPRNHGNTLVAKVSWWGCAGDEFAVRSRQQLNGNHVRWIWIERHPSHICPENETQHQILQLPHHELMDHSSKGAFSLLAMPPGHQYTALQLKECPVGQSS